MLRIAICDDDKRFTGELEKIIIKECNIKRDRFKFCVNVKN